VVQIDKVMLPYSKEDPTKYRDYGFVHYKERSSALEAVNRSHDSKPKLDGKELQVSWLRQTILAWATLSAQGACERSSCSSCVSLCPACSF
jgi:hypothetical protein